MNEYEWAKKALEERRIIDKPYETLCRVARYYMYEGKSKKEVKSLVTKFLLSCDNTISLAKWDERIDSIITYAGKRPIYIVNKICISKDEINTIESISGKQIQRLAFTLLCIAKYSHITNEKNEYWVNTPDNEIMKMANINTSTKRKSAMFSQLKELGLIKFSSKIDNLSVQVLFAGGDDCAMEVKDFRNLGYQYMMYCGEDYYICVNCGITCKSNEKSGKHQKYCRDCAAKIHTKQRIDSIMRKRCKTQNVDISNSYLQLCRNDKSGCDVSINM